jgi:hypothetical protein
MRKKKVVNARVVLAPLRFGAGLKGNVTGYGMCSTV